VHHVGILYGQFMMHGQRNIKLNISISILDQLWSFDRLGLWCFYGKQKLHSEYRK